MSDGVEITPSTENNAAETVQNEIPENNRDIDNSNVSMVTDTVADNIITNASNDKNNLSDSSNFPSTSVASTTLTVDISPPKLTPKQGSQHPNPPPVAPPFPSIVRNEIEAKTVKKKDERRNSEATNRSVCPICEGESVKKKNVLKCSNCNKLIHFACSNLPPYMLYCLSNSTKKYTCERCAGTPESFLTGIVTSICDPSATAEKTGSTEVNDVRVEILEHKVNSILVVLEKFNISTIAENLNELGLKIEQTNNNLTGNVRAIQQMKKDQEASSIEVKLGNNEQLPDELQRLQSSLETAKKELLASQASNELLISSITERDKTLGTIREKFDKNVQKVNERDRRVVTLENENCALNETNRGLSNEKAKLSEQWSAKAQSLSRERDQCFEKLEEVQNRLIDVSQRFDTTVEVNNTLKEQIKELVELNKTLQTSISDIPTRRSLQSRERVLNNEDEEEEREDEDGSDGVVIFHDSMCRNVNDSLLSREQIKVKKVWAPDIVSMEEALDTTNAKVIVLAAFTRDLGNGMEVDEMNQKIVGLVSKALTKAEKVVLSTIIRREDIDDIDLKADLVNAHMILKYKRNENVVVCNNYQLYDGQFRKNDKLHLNDDGVRIFASSLKYAIAEALDVRVIQKKNNNNFNR